MNADNPLFLSPEKRKSLEEFQKLRIDHPKLIYVQRQVDSALVSRDGSFLLLVIGPTHVGKSSLQRRLVYERLERERRERSLSEGSVPAVFFELIPGDKSFSWKANIESLLLEQNEVLTRFKSNIRTVPTGRFPVSSRGFRGGPPNTPYGGLSKIFSTTRKWSFFASTRRRTSYTSVPERCCGTRRTF